jgi:hypothetical protein
MLQAAAAARAARVHAYAPHSRFAVAALLDEHDRSHAGCNVENAAYPQGLWAEAAARAHLVSAGAQRVLACAVVGEAALPVTPPVTLGPPTGSSLHGRAIQLRLHRGDPGPATAPDRRYCVSLEALSQGAHPSAAPGVIAGCGLRPRSPWGSWVPSRGGAGTQGAIAAACGV